MPNFTSLKVSYLLPYHALRTGLPRSHTSCGPSLLVRPLSVTRGHTCPVCVPKSFLSQEYVMS